MRPRSIVLTAALLLLGPILIAQPATAGDLNIHFSQRGVVAHPAPPVYHHHFRPHHRPPPMAYHNARDERRPCFVPPGRWRHDRDYGSYRRDWPPSAHYRPRG
jgi:hypothetical protein